MQSNSTRPATRPSLLALACATAVMLGMPLAALAQPKGAGPIAAHGGVQVQQTGKKSLVVTTRNGEGTQHSVIDWKSFSVPKGSTTHFAQPSVDSTSINRVTGKEASSIAGTLSSNGRLVLVNPAGIAVSKDGAVDTAGFTASTLDLSDADAIAGRLRFTASGKSEKLDVDGHVLARAGDVVLLGNDVRIDKSGVVQAPGGTVILAAGQRVEITGRGLEGIRMELVARKDRVVHLGQIQGGAVGIFTAELEHSGAIQATGIVRIEDKLHLRTEPAKPDDKDKGGKGDKDKDEDKGGKGGKGDKDEDKDKGGKGPGKGQAGNEPEPGNGNGNGNGPVAGGSDGGTVDNGSGGGGTDAGAPPTSGPILGGGTPDGGNGGTGNAGNDGGGSSSGGGETPQAGGGPIGGTPGPAAPQAPATQARTSAIQTMQLVAASYRGAAETTAQATDPARTSSGSTARKRAAAQPASAADLCAP